MGHVKMLLLGISVLVAAVAGMGAAEAQKRVAFVVGIDRYDNLDQRAQLRKARADAQAIGRTLKGLGFDVIQLDDASRSQFNARWQDFLNKLAAGDTAAFFFAGHGVELGGRNYLLPRDIPSVRPGRDELLKRESLSLQEFLADLREKGTRLNLVILDACRDNPFEQVAGRSLGGSRGLAVTEPPEGTFIMFSAGTGESALDRLGDADANPNSVYTRQLLPLLAAPGLSLTDVAEQVRVSVRQLASTVPHRQTPAYYNQVIGRACLAGDCAAVTAVRPLPAPAPPPPPHAREDTLASVRGRGTLRCGVNVGLPGFSAPDDKGSWSGIDVDYCRALAAAVLGDQRKVTFKPLTARERFVALQSGEIDVLARNSSWTTARETQLGLAFVGTIFHDGQGFMVRKAIGVKSAKELNGATVCVHAGTTTELSLADYFRAGRMEYKPAVFQKADEVLTAYLAGRCDVYTNDSSALAIARARFPVPQDHVILPETITRELLGPYVRRGDEQWLKIAQWTLHAIVKGEELGVTSGNIGQLAAGAGQSPETRVLLGLEGDIGASLGLDRAWSANVIKAVGNYAEVYERNFGATSRMALPRGLNALSTSGGLLQAPPFR